MTLPIRKRFGDSMRDIKENADHRFEEAVVSRLLTYFGLASQKSMLRNRENDSSGESRLSLSMFQYEFPQLPIYLVSHALYRVESDVSIGKVFTCFDKTKLYKAYDDYSDVIPDSIESCKPYGLVVQWPRMRNGFILHDMPVDVNDGGMRLIYRNEDRCLVLESFDAFLDHLPEIEFITF